MIVSRGLNEINIVSNNTKPVENEIGNVYQKSGQLTQITDPARPMPSLRMMLGIQKKAAQPFEHRGLFKTASAADF